MEQIHTATQLFDVGKQTKLNIQVYISTHTHAHTALKYLIFNAAQPLKTARLGKNDHTSTMLQSSPTDASARSDNRKAVLKLPEK
jgi:hypothetical protein